MSQEHYNTKQKHLTEVDRYKIEALLKENISKRKIAEQLGKSVRTIQREVKRGTISLMNSDLTMREEYCPDYAQRDYIQKSANKGANYKIGNDHALVAYLEEKIGKEGYSPDAAIGRIALSGQTFKTQLCTKTVYNYIDAGLFLNISNKDLLIKKNPKKRRYKKRRVALNNTKGTSIEARPEEIENRETYGHWEIDLIVGTRRSKSVLLTLTERVSREEMIFKMAAKTQVCVKRVLDKLEKKLGIGKFAETFKSITADNGVEFLDFKGIEQSISKKNKKRTKVYYAHPYSSWERGSNENANRIIRRFIPKGTDISTISEKMIKRIENWMNHYPRRILGYKTPIECRQAALQAI